MDLLQDIVTMMSLVGCAVTSLEDGTIYIWIWIHFLLSVWDSKEPDVHAYCVNCLCDGSYASYLPSLRSAIVPRAVAPEHIHNRRNVPIERDLYYDCAARSSLDGCERKDFQHASWVNESASDTNWELTTRFGGTFVVFVHSTTLQTLRWSIIFHVIHWSVSIR